MRGCLNTKSACCPARNPKLAPFVSNQKAIVSRAILCRSTKVISYSGMDLSFARTSLGSYCCVALQLCRPKFPKLYSDLPSRQTEPCDVSLDKNSYKIFETTIR